MNKYHKTFVLLALTGLLSALPYFAQTPQDSGQDDPKSVGVRLRPSPAPRTESKLKPAPQPKPTPAAKTKATRRKHKPAPKPKRLYRTSKNSSFGAPPPQGKTKALIGITVFRAETAKELPNTEAGPFFRIEDNTPLTPGDKIRIAIESSVGGYLYIINRELYDNGTRGRALLLFPTLRTYGGDNRIEPGLPRMIGSQTVRPNSKAKKEGKRQVAESLTIIISPVRLGLPYSLGNDEMILPDEIVAGWEQQWSVPTARASLTGGAGKTQTPREADASRELPNSNSEAQLTTNDLLPQNVYEITLASGKPALFTVNLRFKAAS